MRLYSPRFNTGLLEVCGEQCFTFNEGGYGLTFWWGLGMIRVYLLGAAVCFRYRIWLRSFRR